jgi:hypothetical protein
VGIEQREEEERIAHLGESAAEGEESVDLSLWWKGDEEREEEEEERRGGEGGRRRQGVTESPPEERNARGKEKRNPLLIEEFIYLFIANKN